jgi:hypothetical protein
MKKSCFVILISIIVFTACKKENNTNCVVKKNNVVNKNCVVDTNRAESDFPNNVGNKYVYSVTDSVNRKTFNVNVVITGITTLPNGNSATIWTFTYPDHIDTNYVTSNGNGSVVFFDKLKINVVKRYYFPLTVGKQWYNSFNNDICQVAGFISLSTEGASCPDTYLITESAFSPNYHLSGNQWYVLGVGMAKMNFREFNFSPLTVQSWTLISYMIK